MAQHEEISGPLDRYMQVLELIVAIPGALTLADVARLLDLPKTTAHRLLKGLVRADLAKDSIGGRAYVLGDRIMRLLHAAADDGWIATLARGPLQRLAEISAETCYLTRLKGTRVFVTISSSPEVRWRSYVQPGIEMPLNAAATAKAIMAYQSEELLAAALRNELPLLTANTRNDKAWIRSQLKQVRAQGYATCKGEIDEGLAAVAVPIFLTNESVLHAVGMTGPFQRIMNKQLHERLALLKATADRLARALSIGQSLKDAEGRNLTSAE
jgi:DNA-binding IclR family transcriptional regulator